MVNWLLYDGDCPFCAAYARLLRVNKAVGGLDLRNAREHLELAKSLHGNGFDVDKGIVLSLGGETHYGADSMRALALMSGRSGILNRIVYLLFSGRIRSQALTPYCGVAAPSCSRPYAANA